MPRGACGTLRTSYIGLLYRTLSKDGRLGAAAAPHWVSRVPVLPLTCLPDAPPGRVARRPAFLQGVISTRIYREPGKYPEQRTRRGFAAFEQDRKFISRMMIPEVSQDT